MSFNDRFDEEPISFGEAFGINPDGTPYEAPTPDPTNGGDDAADDSAPATESDATTAGTDESSDAPDAPADAPAAPTETEWTKRGFEAGDFTERGWKTYRELETKFSQTRPAEATPAPEAAPAVPLFKGEVGEIKTEADLYNWAAADPEQAALFAMANHERLNEEQLNNVMDNWLARQPWKAQTTIRAWDRQMYQDDLNERQRTQDEHYVNNVRETGIAAAITELPMLNDYRQELGAYIESHPQLAQLVDGAKTADELKSALHGAFYMMAGPKLAAQALEAQVAKQVQAAQAAEAETTTQTNGKKAQSMSRNTAVPATNTEDDAIRDLILNSKRK